MMDDAVERFWAKVDKTGDCWLWLASTTKGGYGKFWVHGRTMTAHAFAYWADTGNEPPAKGSGLQLDHLCRTRACVNPNHLELVTSRENQRRGNSPAGINARKTHCIRGHEFTPDNVGYNSHNGRSCKACGRARAKRRYRDKKLAMQ